MFNINKLIEKYLSDKLHQIEMDNLVKVSRQIEALNDMICNNYKKYTDRLNQLENRVQSLEKEIAILKDINEK